jgi:DNA-binding NtrC family response regulator
MPNHSMPSILVVDDEPALLRLMQAFLQRTGYKVDICTDAAPALEKFRSSPDGYHVVIADVTLPEMSGDQMALQMAEANPDLRVLLCSGYPYDLETLPAGVRPRFATLQKPFLPDALTSAVAELLERSF